MICAAGGVRKLFMLTLSGDASDKQVKAHALCADGIYARHNSLRAMHSQRKHIKVKYLLFTNSLSIRPLERVSAS